MGTSKRTTWILAAFLAAGPFCFAQSSGKTVRHHKVAVEESSVAPELTEAESAIEKKDYVAAEPLLQKVVAADPGNYTAWFDLGFVNHALGKTEESIAAYRKSVAAKPDVFESNLNLGLMLAKNGQPDAAEYLRAATKLTPTANQDEGRARAWQSLGHVLESEKPDEAIDAYKQAASLQPSDPEPHLSAGMLLEKQNRFADAEDQFQQTLAIDLKSADALTGLANVYIRGHRFGDAEQVLRRLVGLRPNDAGAHMQLGRMLAADGQNDAAIAELETASKLAPSDETVRRDLADVSARAGKYDVAEGQYKSLLASAPRDPELRHGLGRAYLMQKKFAEAQQELLLAVALKPDLGPAWGDLATAASENKNYELAIKAVDERGKYLPEIPGSYFLRASAYDHLRDYKDAAENYRRFLDVAGGQYPDQEWQARHRLIAIDPKKR
jgi:tetratricopeptide (TPR) repeat protein